MDLATFLVPLIFGLIGVLLGGGIQAYQAARAQDFQLQIAKCERLRTAYSGLLYALDKALDTMPLIVQTAFDRREVANQQALRTANEELQSRRLFRQRTALSVGSRAFTHWRWEWCATMRCLRTISID